MKILILTVLLFNSITQAANSDLMSLRLNELTNCQYKSGSSRSRITDRFVSGENKRWIRSPSISRLFKTIDTLNNPYPFNPISDIYITPEGFQFFISQNHTTLRPEFVIFSFGEHTQFQSEKGIFDLIANKGIPTAQIQGSRVEFFDMICNLENLGTPK